MGARKKLGHGGPRPGAGRKRVVQEPERIAVDMERPQVDRMRQLAAERGVSFAALVREAVDRFLATRGRR